MWNNPALRVVGLRRDASALAHDEGRGDGASFSWQRCMDTRRDHLTQAFDELCPNIEHRCRTGSRLDDGFGKRVTHRPHALEPRRARVIEAARNGGFRRRRQRCGEAHAVAGLCCNIARHDADVRHLGPAIDRKIGETIDA
jgi:hypothetical protein